MARRPLSARMLDLIERIGNVLPHPFWLFCGLIVAVVLGSAALQMADTRVQQPDTQLLTTTTDKGRSDGVLFTPQPGQTVLHVDLGAASHSSRLADLSLQIFEGDTIVYQRIVERSDLADLSVDADKIDEIQPGGTYRVHVVNQPAVIAVRSLLSADGLTWFVLNMVENFAHFEPLGLVLVMLMGVAVAEGSGLIPTAMRGIALSVPRWLIIPVLFALGACGNIGSDAGIVVIPPLAAAVFKQMGRNPIAGLLVGYVGATAGFTANVLPAGTDVLAMSLTNAATGGNPEVNVFCNWYFMSVSVVFLAAVGTWVTFKYTLPRLQDSGGQETPGPDSLQPAQRRALLIASGAIVVSIAIWLLTIVPEWGLLRHADPDPALVWRSPFFKGLVPILFSVFVVGGLAYGIAAKTLTKADDVVSWMADSMRRMGPYIVLILVISQFIRMFQYAHFDALIAVKGADLLQSMGMAQWPVPFFIAFVLLVAVANLFMGSASAKWAIFAPIFVPMFMTLDVHPAFTQLLYRLGDSITNCVSPLYPFFPILLGWIAMIDPDKAKVGTVLSFLVPYASWLMVAWMIMLVIWYFLGLPVGPDSPIHLSG